MAADMTPENFSFSALKCGDMFSIDLSSVGGKHLTLLVLEIIQANVWPPYEYEYKCYAFEKKRVQIFTAKAWRLSTRNFRHL